MLLMVFLGCLATVACEEMTTFVCGSGECYQTNINQPLEHNWMVKWDDSFFGIDHALGMVMASSLASNIAIGFTYSGNALMILNGNNRAGILVTDRIAYLLDDCKTSLSFKDAVATSDSFWGFYTDDCLPFMSKITNKTIKNEGFDLRSLFVHLYDHKDAKNAECLKDRNKLMKRINKSFGEVLNKLHDAYQAKDAYVYQYEGAILALIFSKEPKQASMQAGLVPVFVYRMELDMQLKDLLFTGTVWHPEGFKDKAVQLWFSRSLIVGSLSMTRLNATEVTLVDKKGKEYYLSFGKDEIFKNTEIKVRKCDGTLDLSILYLKQGNSWSFLCHVTNFALVLPEKTETYGLFNMALGAGIAVNKTTQKASITPISNDMIENFRTYVDKYVIYEMSSVLESAKADSFNFKSFLLNSYSPTGILLMPASLKCRSYLSKNFERFMKGFRLIQGYRMCNGASNVVLYFFKSSCLDDLKESYQEMVGLLGVQDSNFRCHDMMVAIYESTYRKYV